MLRCSIRGKIFILVYLLTEADIEEIKTYLFWVSLFYFFIIFQSDNNKYIYKDYWTIKITGQYVLNSQTLSKCT